MRKTEPKFKTGQVVAFIGDQAWRGYGKITSRWQEAVGGLRLRWRYNVSVPNWQIVDVAEKEVRRLYLREIK